MFIATARASGIPVVSAYHGESSGTYDEPAHGFGENAYSTSIVGYGDEGMNTWKSSKYSVNLFGNNVDYFPSSGNYVRNVFDQKPVAKIATRETNVLYLPTSLLGDGTFGPFRQLQDVGYAAWQLDLIHAMTEIPLWNVLYKQHPKTSTEITLNIDGVEHVRGALEDALERSDIVVIDYFSTAACLAAATTKPIIYLDLGIRNLTDESFKSFGNRTIRVRSSPEQANQHLASAIEIMNTQGDIDHHEFTRRFSLSKDGATRAEAVAKAIQHSLK